VRNAARPRHGAARDQRCSPWSPHPRDRHTSDSTTRATRTYQRSPACLSDVPESAIWARPHGRFEADGTIPMSSEPTAKSATPPTPRTYGGANVVVTRRSRPTAARDHERAARSKPARSLKYVSFVRSRIDNPSTRASRLISANNSTLDRTTFGPFRDQRPVGDHGQVGPDQAVTTAPGCLQVGPNWTGSGCRPRDPGRPRAG
jgi:hypothetical protein